MASQTEAEVKHWSVSSAWRGLSKPVFIPSIIIIGAALIFATWFGRAYGAEAFEGLNSAIVSGVGWWYILIVTGFVVFALWAGLSKAGSIRLGRDDEKPEFSLISWFTMLFSAGMGIGLIFWGVAEPLNHFVNPPEQSGEAGVGTDGETIMATEAHISGTAIGETLFHWGLHAWAIYVVVGLGLAYMTYRRGRPLSVRWLLEPVFGRKLIESWLGHAIDVIAIVGTIFGVVTSLGLGVQQIVAGLEFMGWVESNNTVLVTLVVIITAIATLSVVSGVHKGLKWLSNINMSLAASLAIFVLVAGPTLFLLQQLVSNAGEYAISLPQLMFETGAGYAGGDGLGAWSADWTIYYWGWWMSWSPFVGMFIARISRGRTIREFVLGVLLAPTVIAILWFTIFGSTGIWYQITQGIMVDDEGAVGTEAALFTMLDQLPLSMITASIAILVVALFFITSSDSGSLVVDVLATGGRPDTPRLTRVFWALLEGFAAIVLLTAAGEAAGAALRVLQISSIAAAAPLSIVLVVAVIGLIRMLRYEGATASRYIRIRPQASKASLVHAARSVAGTDDGPAVERSLRRILSGQNRMQAGMLGGPSATLAGLAPEAGRQGDKPGTVAADDMVFAVQDIPAHATSVNPETGTIGWDEDAYYQDPIAHEEFDTPEFAKSAEGWTQESEIIYEEVAENGGSSSDSTGSDEPEGGSEDLRE